MNTTTASYLIGFVFIAVGILGYIPNPVIADSTDAIFHADAVHSAVHLVSGLLFVVIAFAAPLRVVAFLKIFGIVYFLLGVIGLFSIGSSGMTKLLGFLHVNGADNYLHIGLGLIIFLASMLKGKVE